MLRLCYTCFNQYHEAGLNECDGCFEQKLATLNNSAELRREERETLHYESLL